MSESETKTLICDKCKFTVTISKAEADKGLATCSACNLPMRSLKETTKIDGHLGACCLWCSNIVGGCALCIMAIFSACSS